MRRLSSDRRKLRSLRNARAQCREVKMSSISLLYYFFQTHLTDNYDMEEKERQTRTVQRSTHRKERERHKFVHRIYTKIYKKRSRRAARSRPLLRKRRTCHSVVFRTCTCFAFFPVYRRQRSREDRDGVGVSGWPWLTIVHVSECDSPLREENRAEDRHEQEMRLLDAVVDVDRRRREEAEGRDR